MYSPRLNLQNTNFDSKINQNEDYKGKRWKK